MSDLLEPLSTSEYVVEEILRYGLFLGAIFQIICIAAAVWIPSKEIEEEIPAKMVPAGGSGPNSGQAAPASQGKAGGKTKHDKKKRR